MGQTRAVWLVQKVQILVAIDRKSGYFVRGAVGRSADTCIVGIGQISYNLANNRVNNFSWVLINCYLNKQLLFVNFMLVVSFLGVITIAN